jgi:hypothetical protein
MPSAALPEPGFWSLVLEYGGMGGAEWQRTRWSTTGADRPKGYCLAFTSWLASRKAELWRRVICASTPFSAKELTLRL